MRIAGGRSRLWPAKVEFHALLQDVGLVNDGLLVMLWAVRGQRGAGTATSAPNTCASRFPDMRQAAARTSPSRGEQGHACRCGYPNAGQVIDLAQFRRQGRPVRAYGAGGAVGPARAGLPRLASLVEELVAPVGIGCRRPLRTAAADRFCLGRAALALFSAQRVAGTRFRQSLFIRVTSGIRCKGDGRGSGSW